jgi:serine/threonine protein kinase
VPKTMMSMILLLVLVSAANAQRDLSDDPTAPPSGSSGSAGKSSSPAEKAKPTAPPKFEASDGPGALPWLLAGGVIVVLVVGGFIAVNITKKQRENSSGPREAIVPEQGLVFKDYRFQIHLMTGQSSQVWEVVETNSGRHLAMKILLPEQASNPAMRQQLFHEASVGQQLAHPNIIRIHKVDRNRFNPNFVMEFFPSGSLGLKIMRWQKQWDFIREHAHSILKQAATALAFMNAKGWVHRDVKPDNILVNAGGEVRLIDFALAQRMGGGGGFMRKRKCQGTRSYMSPEQILCKPLDGRADIYSFAAAAYELVTGRPPFRAGDSNDLLRKHLVEKPVSPEIHNPQVTKEFADLVLQMLSKKKEARPNDFHMVLMKLKTIKLFKPAEAKAV